MDTVTIGTTTKGRRVWLQGIAAHGQRYDVHYGPEAIVVAFSATGKRKVCPSKGGIVDLVGVQVTTWARGATMAHVGRGVHAITITRANG